MVKRLTTKALVNFIHSLHVYVTLADCFWIKTTFLLNNKSTHYIGRAMWIECIENNVIIMNWMKITYVGMLVNENGDEKILSHSVKSAEFWETMTRRVLASSSARCPPSTFGGWTEQILEVIYSRVCLKIHAGLCSTRRSIAPRRGTNVLGVIYTRLLKNSISPTTSVMSGIWKWKSLVVCVFWLIKFRRRERENLQIRWLSVCILNILVFFQPSTLHYSEIWMTLKSW